MKQIEVAAAVIVKNGKVLATERGYGPYKDWWEFPGGKLEPGETPEEALKREIREEMAAKISVIRLLRTVEYDYPDFHIRMHCFLCNVPESMQFIEHEDHRWLGRDDLYTVKWLPADDEVLKDLESILTAEDAAEESAAAYSGTNDSSVNAAVRVVLIPAYEPDEKILTVVQEAKEAGLTVVVVDDGSGEGYRSVFEEIKDRAHVISYPENHGKGYALKTGYRYIYETYGKQGGSVVTIDCDGQHRMEDAVRLLHLVEESETPVFYLGSRDDDENVPTRSRIGHGISRGLLHIVSGVKINDTQTGLRAHRISVIPELLKIDGNRFEFEMNELMRLPGAGIAIKETKIPTIYFDANKGTHYHTFRDSGLVLLEVLKFCSSSFVSFLIEYGIFSLIIILFGEGMKILANVVGRIISATVNYNINRRLVFKQGGGGSPVKFALLAVSVFLLDTALLWFFSDVCHITPFLAKIMADLIQFIVNFTVQRRVVFVKKQPAEENK